MFTQLTLFDLTPTQYQVTYWAYPFDKKLMYIKNRMDMYQEIKNEFELNEFINILKTVNYQNITYKKL